MTKIILDTDTSDCPGALCKIWQGHRSILVQSEGDACGVAGSFGWSPRRVRRKKCSHDGTDGSIDCPSCGTKSAVFQESARDFIDSNDGKAVDDPGYFENGGDE